MAVTANPKPQALAPLAAPLAPTENPAAVFLAGLAAGPGRRSQHAALDLFAAELTKGQADAASLPWHQVRFAHIAAVRSRWIARMAPASVNSRLSAVRGAIKAAWRLGQVSTDDYMKAIDVENVRGSRLPAGRALEHGEVQALFGACADGSPAGVRDAALFAIMYGCGLRRAEAAALTLADWDSEKARLAVLGKGNKQRAVYLSNGSLEAVRAWLAVRGQQAGPLFLAIGKGGRIAASGMTGSAIAARLKARAAAAGIKACSPHDLRRSHASTALDNGADIAALAANLGHASVQTTARYDRRGERAQRKAAETVFVPFAGSASGPA